MRSVLGLVAAIAIVSSACAEEATTPPPAPPPALPPAPPTPPPADTAAAPPPPQKQVITITTKSADAKTALLKAWDLADNFRNEEALDQCKAVQAADPDFALGRAVCGNLLMGAAAQAELDKAAQLAASLPEAERTYIEAMAATRRQDVAKAQAAFKHVAELAPDDYHARASLGYVLIDQRDFPGVIAAFKKVLELNPAAFYAHGIVSWAQTQLRQYDDAVASARKYAEGAPGESNAHRSLAGALLNVSQVKEADAELSKAVDLAPKARAAFFDLAVVKSLEGDYAGAKAALDRSKAGETLPTDSLDRATRTAWVLLAEGKVADAFKLLDATEKDIDARKLAWPSYAAQSRGWAQWILGKYADAIKTAQGALPRCDRPEASGAFKAGCRVDLLTITAYSQIALGKTADAQATVAKLQDEAKASQGNEWIRVGVDVVADRVAALASKDGKAAAAVLGKVPPDDAGAKLGVLRQLEAARDKAGAEQVRKDILSRPILDPGYPLIARVVKK
jgi:Flp pilus assembly protein TadD